MPSEAEIVWSLKKHLQQTGLGPQAWPITDIAVDSDGSYRNSPHAADLEPMMSMPIRGFHPDLVCAYAHPQEEGLAAFEVKPRFDDWLKGLTQARAYREGVHRAYVALPEDRRSRISGLESDARERGVGVWLLRKERWEELVPPAPPRPGVRDSCNLGKALRGVVLPRRLQLNHPLNYLAAVWARFSEPQIPLIQALETSWKALRVSGSRRHAINGACYLGLLNRKHVLTDFGLTVCELIKSMGFNSAENVHKKRRLIDESPGLAAVTRLVLMQQESTKLVIDALKGAGSRTLNTEQLLREAAKINAPLTSGLFLAEPRAIEALKIPSSSFSQSFVFQFKQSLYHAGILAIPMHKSAGKGAAKYQHLQDGWKLDPRFVRSP